MKLNNYLFLLIIGFTMLAAACKKGEPLQKEPVKVVKVSITGSTTVPLEFIYKDSIIASVDLASRENFIREVLLPVSNQSSEISIREAGTTNVIDSHTVPSSPFKQNLSVYYDGSQTYEKSITYQLKGFAMAGELEFLVDEKLVHTGTLKIEKNLTIYVNENKERQFTVRKKGETTNLLTKTVTSSPSTGQSLKFFFDGTRLVDNIEIKPPANPENMSVTAQFATTFTIASAGALFKGGDVDAVFYIRNSAGVVTVPSPEIRIKMPASGAFVTFELPPLPNSTSFYTYDICEVGSDALPYTDFLVANIFPPKLNKGKLGEIKFGSSYFEAGAAKLILMQDMMALKSSPAAEKGRYFFGKILDLSQYFQ
ncbi:hypothetical protein FBD94_17885 [Pedobacter hiemivivus]|uniref:Uncharacterized protein n=1 Tax=Pedobacter hiemivivus TaxID=2530454 RepID=A0A4R0MDG8_9SPHI|nr:hypothetical protein [Pedobacter hiemivivus]TCC84017.1 hypothetical protein EZ444_25705 [Pedobacter hiemivivus]TKC58492.1 hypothetical protein FBD94_17885 [Pedobacter hiemivivus]